MVAKLSRQQLADLERDGAKVTKREGASAPAEKTPKPPSPKPPSTTATKKPLKDYVDDRRRAAEFRNSLQAVVDQNAAALSEMSQSIADLARPKSYDIEVIRDKDAKGAYKPMTHLRVRAQT